MSYRNRMRYRTNGSRHRDSLGTIQVTTTTQFFIIVSREESMAYRRRIIFLFLLGMF